MHCASGVTLARRFALKILISERELGIVADISVFLSLGALKGILRAGFTARLFCVLGSSRRLALRAATESEGHHDPTSLRPAPAVAVSSISVESAGTPGWDGRIDLGGSFAAWPVPVEFWRGVGVRLPSLAPSLITIFRARFDAASLLVWLAASPHKLSRLPVHVLTDTGRLCRENPTVSRRAAQKIPNSGVFECLPFRETSDQNSRLWFDLREILCFEVFRAETGRGLSMFCPCLSAAFFTPPAPWPDTADR